MPVHEALLRQLVEGAPDGGEGDFEPDGERVQIGVAMFAQIGLDQGKALTVGHERFLIGNDLELRQSGTDTRKVHHERHEKHESSGPAGAWINGRRETYPSRHGSREWLFCRSDIFGFFVPFVVNRIGPDFLGSGWIRFE
jgi:hypothetical protein